MHFQVPQFIEVEDKIIGPFTLRQFLYLGGAGFFLFITFYIFELGVWIMLSIFVATLAFTFAFYKPNNQSMERVLLSAFKFFWNPRMYFWQRKEKTLKVDLETVFKSETARPQIFKKTARRLADEDIKRLASKLDK